MAPTHTFAPLSAPTPDRLLVVTLDALVSGVHFPADARPADVGVKSAAVNLSDLAAMGADPLALQAACQAGPGDGGWLDGVAAGLREAAREAGVDIEVACREGRERRVCVHALGTVPEGEALTRAGARPGDGLWVSGTLGDAGGGLALLEGRLRARRAPDRGALLARLARPRPRLVLGRALRGIASAAIDVSDGIAGDAGHLARRSEVRLLVQCHRLPLSAALRRVAGAARAAELALASGDDYELLFTVPPRREAALADAARGAGTPVSRIGRVSAGRGLALLDVDGRPRRGAAHGYEHFGPRPAATR